MEYQFICLPVIPILKALSTNELTFQASFKWVFHTSLFEDHLSLSLHKVQATSSILFIFVGGSNWGKPMH